MRSKEKHFKKEITKVDLVEYLVHTEGLSRYKANNVVNKIIEYVVINLGSFNKVKISGLGSFSPNYVKSRLAYIPFSKEKKVLDPKLRVFFKPERLLKSLLQEQITKFEEIFDVDKKEEK
jgi:nucleoid DNA-binding protein